MPEAPSIADAVSVTLHPRQPVRERLSKGDKELFRHARVGISVSFGRDDWSEIVPHLQETFTKVLERGRSLQGASRKNAVFGGIIGSLRTSNATVPAGKKETWDQAISSYGVQAGSGVCG